MPPRRSLHGQEPLVRHVRDLLAAGRSVLLFGPEGIGKSAIVAAVAGGGVATIDPFERISRQRACDIRRALDRGAVVLAAARTAERRRLGAVGRILWRFTLVRVRELPAAALRRVVSDELGPLARDAGDDWIRDVVALARGRPGFASAMGRFARQWRTGHGYLPLPALAFAAVREDAAIHALGADGPMLD